jgi:Cu-Zn family superoxide dismutase
MLRLKCLAIAGALLAAAPGAYAAEGAAVVHLIDINGVGAELGKLTLRDTKQGLLIEPDIFGLPTGAHGFHVHEKGSCDPAEKNGLPVPGLAAGGHFDPRHTGEHLGPEGNGHLGDLPVLVFDKDRKATLPVLAQRLKFKDVKGRAIMITALGDTYSDEPVPLGDGGLAIACAIIR